MIKNIVTSMITTVIVIVFVLIGLDVFVNNEAKTQIENISYEDNKERKVEFVYEENNSVVSTSSVVGIAVKKNSGNKIAQVLDSTWSVGSGCILDSKGYIITNQHVIGNEKDDIFVTLYGGDSIKGELIWSSNLLDLAVIKINIGGLPSAVMGDSDSLRIGERAIAIGNPLGFDFQGTLTSGVISGLNRTVEVNGIYMEDLIQTDASINSGNSGGPLMNSKGEVIGINTVKVASAEGIGFAIPINQIKPIIDKIVKNGEFIEPYFGVLAYDKAMTSYISSDIKLDTGIFVYDIDYGSPAYISGIRKGNIILTVDDIPIDTLCEFRSILFSKNISEKMRVKILNDKGEKEVVVQVKSK
jgi:S1-C subfamily serine protease